MFLVDISATSGFMDGILRNTQFVFSYAHSVLRSHHKNNADSSTRMWRKSV